MAERLSKKTPFFKMQGGGVYACAVNKEGEGIYFIRVDKDRRPVKIRKRERRNIRAYKEAMIANAGAGGEKEFPPTLATA